VGVVGEAVEDGIGEGGIVEVLVPGADGELAGDDGGAGVEAVVEEFEEVAAVPVGEGGDPPIVDLCGAEHKSTYGEHAVMWSRVPSCVLAVVYRGFALHIFRGS
jgi:hypothetical protein